METRKIQTVGNGTYTVSLPKEWAESRGVSAGDAVTLHEHVDGVLAIQEGEGGDDTAPITVRVESSDPETIERTLRAAYAAGSREVVLEPEGGLTAERRRTIDRVARGRIGMSVVTESETAATVRILLDPEEVSVGQSLRQLSFVVRSIHRDAVDALADRAASKEPATFDSRGEQADRLSAMIERSAVRGAADLAEIDALGSTRSELFESWTAMRELRRVHEAAAAIGAAAGRLDAPPAEARTESCRAIGRAAREAVSEGVAAVLGDGDVDAARSALDARDRARRRIEAFDRELSAGDADASELRHVSRELGRTAERGADVAALALRRAIRRGETVADREPERGPAESPSR
ncbi:AbrB/MazE/SpoVT family DNA-binding domain-containing protein [Halorubrum halodurans]|uniref:Transcriptional regulator n=1 Tax=Halorubrum halodurans TaxID=1383851 RepID=A0A256ISY3_9EURY|nr:AbrB/MazE/SpoVT family DNA-binding domain-containing protein [Halorubrum halodurans]OYR59252.1 transcriptional regulator [Halorubrum halodurans]